VLDQLEQLLGFIGRALSDVSVSGGAESDGQVVSDARSTVSGSGSGSLAGWLGDQLIGELYERVYTDCLADLVHTDSQASWQTLESMLQLTQRFQNNVATHLHQQPQQVLITATLLWYCLLAVP